MILEGVPRYLWERVGRRSVARRARSRTQPGAVADVRRWIRSPAVPRLTICIPIKDRLDLLLPCLASLARSTDRQYVEVVIGDTGSSTETLELLDFLGVRLVSVGGEFNFSRACNQMANVAAAPSLLFLNSDTEALTHDWIRHLLEVPGGDVIGAALVYPGTARLQHAGVRVVPARAWPQLNAYYPRGLRTGNSFALENVGIGRRLTDTNQPPVDVMAVTGAFLSTSRARFDSLNGFDETFETDLQDIDYCLRARVKGARVLCRRDIVFSHRHAASRGRYPFPSDDWSRFVERWGDELERWMSLERGAGG